GCEMVRGGFRVQDSVKRFFLNPEPSLWTSRKIPYVLARTTPSLAHPLARDRLHGRVCGVDRVCVALLPDPRAGRRQSRHPAREALADGLVTPLACGDPVHHRCGDFHDLPDRTLLLPPLFSPPAHQ